MLDYFVGKKQIFGDKIYLTNDFFGIEIFTNSKKDSGEFFLHHIIDINNKHIVYYAFENFESKKFFEKMLDIPGVGGKMALILSSLDQNQLQDAIKQMDIKYFQSIPGVGPKLAKRLLIELKPTISQDQMQNLEKDEKVFKNIQKTLGTLGYNSEKVKELLEKCEIKFEKQNTGEIIKRVIDRIG